MKYTILHVNDRAKDLIDQNKKVLKNFEFIDSISFFNGNIDNPWDELALRGINVSSWSPYDGRKSGPLPGELGIWISYLNIFEYIIKTKTQHLLVVEDDARVKIGAASDLYSLMEDLPKDWDFLSLHFNEWNFQNKLTKESRIDSKTIHKSINQLSSTVAIIYSYSCAEKFLKLVREKGIEYTIDCFLHRQSILGLLNGYSVIPNTSEIVFHEGDNKTIKSVIDPDSLRYGSLH
jgi:GR25 family glycosyltransferase involved in LPS biosynthesis